MTELEAARAQFEADKATKLRALDEKIARGAAEIARAKHELATIRRELAACDRETAFHEAGHACVALSCGLKVERVTMVGLAKDTGGQTTTVVPEQLAVLRFLVTAAGPIAHRRVAPEGKDLSEQAASDNKHIKQYLAEIVAEMKGATEADVERRIRALYGLAEDCVAQNWRAIKRVAAALLERKSLTGDEIKALFGGGKLQEAA